MPIDNPVELTDDFVVKSLLGKPFDKFKNTMKKEKLEEFFKKDCFGRFLWMPKDNNAHFQMSMVYGLLKRRIKYVGDDKDLTGGWMKIWINYYGMPICFSMKEFDRVIGLRCDRPKEPLIKETPSIKSKASNTAKPPPSNKDKTLSKQPPTKTNKCKEKIDGLLDITGRGYKIPMFVRTSQG
ncbi:hypothetical protein FXO37_06713 [Capsicum annuum]|nr:hypothetical protein FXO37_06713 [Capsicum annuum]